MLRLNVEHSAPVRGMRADGVRNRALVIDAARAAFAHAGQRVTLAAIAQDAGVGIGTLYRHFPTRTELVEAVYRDELDRLGELATAAAATVSSSSSSSDSRRRTAEHSAARALRDWMDAYVDFVAAKRQMADELAAVLAAGTVTSPGTRAALSAAVAALLAAGRAGSGDGTLRADVRAEDVVAGLAGIVLGNDVVRARDQVSRVLDLLLDGLRTGR